MSNKTGKKIKVGDTVQVISGSDKDKQGKVLKILRDKNRALVEKVRLVKKHQKAVPGKTQGGIVEMEASIHLSNLKKIETSSNKTEK